MPCLPKIDQPCPLTRGEQAGLDGYCGRCAKTVHVLDGMSSEQRRTLLQRASGPICVSYRVSAGLGAALALSLAASPALATSAGQAPATLPVATQQSGLSPLAGALPADAPTGPQSPLAAPAETPPTCEDEVMIMVGGISRPDDAQWLEQDGDLPELPMREAPVEG